MGEFQFTQPKRAATQNLEQIIYPLIVSIHAAQTGCDTHYAAAKQYSKAFQFTQPKRAATGWGMPAGIEVEFQFTQPKRAATGNGGRVYFACPFQFTQPKRAATALRFLSFGAVAVSIHAAQAGCDDQYKEGRITYKRFQFTQPKRAATAIFRPSPMLLVSFNSRSPSGLRPKYRGLHGTRTVGFNSRSPSGLRLVWSGCGCCPQSFNSRSPSGLRPHRSGASG